MRRSLAALLAGVLVALAVSGLPAIAAKQTIAANNADNSWSPKDVTIEVGEDVEWTNPNAGFHNVCVFKPGSSGSTCDEFRNGEFGPDWSGYTNKHTFTTAGVYKFFCQAHGTAGGAGMAGTVTVNSSGTGTTNTDTVTDTTTVPTNTTPTGTQPAIDSTPPTFTGKLKRKSSRKSLILQLGSSEDARLKATVSRRAPGKRSFTTVGSGQVKVKSGRNTVTLPRQIAGKMRAGAYRVKLQLVDYSNNRSGTRTLNFKLA